MKIFFKEHGGMAIAAVAAAAIITLLLNSMNFLDILGAKASIEGVSYEAYADAAATDRILTSKKPQIAFVTASKLKKDTEYDLESVFEVTADSAYSFTVKEILDEQGNGITDDYPHDAYRFPKKGIYSVTVAARKTDGIELEKQFYLPVR